MYSGSDSTESANYGQWPLNPAFFQNMPNEQVDWAALAQQWIQMKEAGPPIPEPKPNIVPEVKVVPQQPKEVVLPISTEDNAPNPTWNSVINTIEPYDSSWNWKTQQNWEWGNPAWNSQPIVNPPTKQVSKGYLSVDAPKESAAISSGYTSVKSNEFGTSFSGHSTQNASRNYKPHNRRYSKVNAPKPSTPSPVNIPPIPEIDSGSLDANKRKQLPAWIREGLEKMEKDKLKQMEREKEKEKLTLFTEKAKEHEKEAMEILKDTINERRRSKFDSDDDQSSKEIEETEEPEPLSHDDLILLVRRTMTEILLKVTNEAINSICTEERQRFLKKTQMQGKFTGKTNVKSKLGLGLYYSDSDSENSDSSTKDSDDELKNSIRKKKADFIHTEKGIEDKLQQAEKEKDSKKKEEDEEENSTDHLVEDNTPEKRKDDGNIKNKDLNSKHCRSSSRSSDESDRRSRKSSSSRGSSLSSKRSHRNKSKGRRRTPDKKKKHKSKRSRSRSIDRRHSSDYKYKKDRNRYERSRRSRSRNSKSSRRSRSRSSSYRSRRSSDRSSRSKRNRSRSPYYSRGSKRSRSRSHGRSSRR